jgi:hypothetical protein
MYLITYSRTFYSYSERSIHNHVLSDYRRVWIGSRIYCTLSRLVTSHFRSVFSVTLPGSGCNSGRSSASGLTSLQAGDHLTPPSYSDLWLQQYFVHLRWDELTHHQVRIEVMLRPTVHRPVSLGVKPYLGPKGRFLLMSKICRFVDVGRPI